MTPARATAERRIFLIATEESGDRLGANLMKVLRQRLGDAVRFEGVGGRAMAREGLTSLFPIEELSIIGLAAVAKQLPKILRLIKQTAAVVLEASSDILIIIDSPDFTHRVARLRSGGLIRAGAGRGALVKAPKGGQDLRFDLPTIGPRTIEGVGQAGLAGIAVIAGNTIAAESQAMIEAADKAGLFIQGLAA